MDMSEEITRTRTMATIKETSGNKKRTYQKATINIVELTGKTSLLSASGSPSGSLGIGIMNNGYFQ